MPTSPIIEALLRRAGRGVGQINTRSSAIGSALKPYAASAGNIYSSAISAEGALSGGVQQQLQGTGQQLGADISGKLAGIQAPGQAIDQFGGGAAAMGAQSGNAVGALSSAEIGRLQGYGTAEEVFASALPRLAQLAGEQERRGFLAQMGDDLTDKMSELSVQQSRDMQENQRYTEERNYGRQQDFRDRRDAMRREQIERSRYRKEQHIERSRYRTQAKREKTLDQLAQAAAAREYGLDYSKTAQDIANDRADNARDWAKLSNDMSDDQIDNALARDNLNERRRSALQREKAARVKDAGKGDKPDTKAVFEQAREYAKAGESAFGTPIPPLTRAEARKRLRVEFPGNPKAIERALLAAGYGE